MAGIPILELDPSIQILSVFKDAKTDSVLLGLSDGRIIKVDMAAATAYLSGERSVFAQLVDGYGNVSEIVVSNLFYRLNNRIIEVNEDKEEVRWTAIERPCSATAIENVKGVFTSPVLWGGIDFGFWKDIRWKQNTPEGTDILVCVRVAETPEELKTAPWRCLEAGESDASNLRPLESSSESSSSSQSSGDNEGTVKSLDHFNLQGSYIQMRAEMTTQVADVTPKMLDLTASYQTKFALFFFTQKFVMESGTNLKTAMITGSVSTPIHTEVKFGVAGTNTADWNDYTPIELDELFELPDSITNKFKVGIKMIAYDDTNFPVVDEFAFQLGGDIDNLLNQEDS